jgi:Fe-S-cluster-containing hydrogenase component 2
MSDHAVGIDQRTARIEIVPELCVGCRTCELACSFHHSGSMAPELSSVQVRRSNRTAAISWQVLPSCDLCAAETEPLCAKYCGADAIRVEVAQ